MTIPSEVLITKFIIAQEHTSHSELRDIVRQMLDPEGWYLIIEQKNRSFRGVYLKDLRADEISEEIATLALSEMLPMFVEVPAIDGQNTTLGHAERLLDKIPSGILLVLVENKPIGLLLDETRSGIFGDLSLNSLVKQRPAYNITKNTIKYRCPVCRNDYPFQEVLDLSTDILQCPNCKTSVGEREKL